MKLEMYISLGSLKFYISHNIHRSFIGQNYLYIHAFLLVTLHFCFHGNSDVSDWWMSLHYYSSVVLHWKFTK